MELDTVRDKVVEQMKAYNNALEIAQNNCLHERVGEVPYKGDVPPQRVCMDCGATESDWSFKRLVPQYVYLFTHRDFDAFERRRLSAK